MTAKWLIVVALLLATSGTAAFGQTDSTQASGFAPRGGHRLGYRYGDYGGYGGFGTYEAGALFGLGAYARGAGEYNLYSAMARREREEARALLIENHRQAVENWHTLRKQHAERRAKKFLDARPTPEQIARINAANRPDRLNASQYEPATGKLNWPAMLLGEEFAEERAALEAAFAKRKGEDAGAASVFHASVKQLTERLAEKLRANSSDLSPMQLIAGKKFLTGLKYESLLPLDDKASAARE